MRGPTTKGPANVRLDFRSNQALELLGANVSLEVAEHVLLRTVANHHLHPERQRILVAGFPES